MLKETSLHYLVTGERELRERETVPLQDHTPYDKTPFKWASPLHGAGAQAFAIQAFVGQSRFKLPVGQSSRDWRSSLELV
jgi:hypothetical protein